MEGADRLPGAVRAGEGGGPAGVPLASRRNSGREGKLLQGKRAKAKAGDGVGSPRQEGESLGSGVSLELLPA